MRVFFVVVPLFFALLPSGHALGRAIDDAVFAHDFKSKEGDKVPPLVGGPGLARGDLALWEDEALRPDSGHLRVSETVAQYTRMRLAARLTAPTTAMSFSIAVNDRGAAPDVARLLSSYDGDGPLRSFEFVFETVLQESGRHLQVRMGDETLVSDASYPAGDGAWHHLGFVLEQGALTFYVDGQPLGSAQPAPEEIPAQALAWHILEDASSQGSVLELFAGGDYDEAALWLRPVSSSDMRDLAQNGLDGAPPALPLAIDIRPWTDKNEIWLGLNMYVYVSVFTNDDIDARDLTDFSFGDPELASMAPSTVWNAYMDGDNRADRFLFFWLPDLIAAGAIDEDTLEMTLTARGPDGQEWSGSEAVAVSVYRPYRRW